MPRFPVGAGRGAALLLAAALTFVLAPRVPAREPFDDSWRRRVGADSPDGVILGNCLVNWFDAAELGRSLAGQRFLVVSEGGTLGDEWYSLLSGSLLPEGGSVKTVILPFVGDEFSGNAADGDLWSRRRAERWAPPDAPRDPRWEAVQRRRGESEGSALAAWGFRPAAWHDAAIGELRGRAQAMAGLSTRGPIGEDLLRSRLGESHFRPEAATLRVEALDAELPAEVRVVNSSLPALLDLANERGARLVLVRLPTHGDGAERTGAFASAALAWAATNGARGVDATADPTLADLLQHDPSSRREAFSRRLAELLVEIGP